MQELRNAAYFPRISLKDKDTISSKSRPSCFEFTVLEAAEHQLQQSWKGQLKICCFLHNITPKLHRLVFTEVLVKLISNCVIFHQTPESGQRSNNWHKCICCTFLAGNALFLSVYPCLAHPTPFWREIWNPTNTCDHWGGTWQCYCNGWRWQHPSAPSPTLLQEGLVPAGSNTPKQTWGSFWAQAKPCSKHTGLILIFY